MKISTYLQLLISGILFGGIYALVATGLTLIIGVMDLANLAHGEYLMLCLYAAFFAVQKGLHPYWSIVITVPLAILLGMVTERLFIRPVIGKPMFVQIFITLGISIVLQNVAMMLWSANYRTIDMAYGGRALLLGDVAISVPRLVIFLSTMVVALALFMFLDHTWLGLAIKATSQNRAAAQLMGISINRVFNITFALGTACAGLAGSLLIPVYAVYPTVGANFSLAAVIAVVMGGMGSVQGAIYAGLFIGLIETLSGFFISAAMKQAVYFLMFILVLVFKPQGLFGEERKVA